MDSLSKDLKRVLSFGQTDTKVELGRVLSRESLGANGIEYNKSPNAKWEPLPHIAPLRLDLLAFEDVIRTGPTPHGQDYEVSVMNLMFLIEEVDLLERSPIWRSSLARRQSYYSPTL